MVPKLEKRGQSEPVIALAVMVLLAVIIVLVVGLFLPYIFKKGEIEAIDEKNKVSDNIFILNYLKTEGISDLTIHAHLTGEGDELAEKTNEFFDDVFGQATCWSIYIGDLNLKRTADCKWPREIFDGAEIKGVAYLPYEIGAEPIAVGFGEKP